MKHVSVTLDTRNRVNHYGFKIESWKEVDGFVKNKVIYSKERANDFHAVIACFEFGDLNTSKERVDELSKDLIEVEKYSPIGNDQYILEFEDGQFAKFKSLIENDERGAFFSAE